MKFAALHHLRWARLISTGHVATGKNAHLFPVPLVALGTGPCGPKLSPIGLARPASHTLNARPSSAVLYGEPASVAKAAYKAPKHIKKKRPLARVINFNDSKLHGSTRDEITAPFMHHVMAWPGVACPSDRRLGVAAKYRYPWFR